MITGPSWTWKSGARSAFASAAALWRLRASARLGAPAAPKGPEAA